MCEQTKWMRLGKEVEMNVDEWLEELGPVCDKCKSERAPKGQWPNYKCSDCGERLVNQ